MQKIIAGKRYTIESEIIQPNDAENCLYKCKSDQGDLFTFKVKFSGTLLSRHCEGYLEQEWIDKGYEIVAQKISEGIKSDTIIFLSKTSAELTDIRVVCMPAERPLKKLN